MACLSRPFRMGMLYDARSDTLIPGICGVKRSLKVRLNQRLKLDRIFKSLRRIALRAKRHTSMSMQAWSLVFQAVWLTCPDLLSI